MNLKGLVNETRPRHGTAVHAARVARRAHLHRDLVGTLAALILVGGPILNATRPVALHAAEEAGTHRRGGTLVVVRSEAGELLAVRCLAEDALLRRLRMHLRSTVGAPRTLR